MRDRILLFGAVLVVAGLATVWFLMNYEKVDVNERGPASALVASNPVYGFQAFLKRYDIESQRLSSLNTAYNMPETDDTLVLGFNAVYLNDEDYERIADWVGAGGHLVLPLPYDTDDSLLAYFNIHSSIEDDENSDEELDSDESTNPLDTSEADEDDSQNDENAASEDTSDSEEPPPQPDRFVYDSRFDSDLFGEFSSSYSVYDDLYSNRQTQWALEIIRKEHDGPEDRRTYALGFQYGLGTISLLSDYAHWNNLNFSEHDNALISLAMLSKVREPGKVWFVQAIQRTNLWDLLWNRAGHLMLWLGLMITLFFWWAGQRIGRVIPNPSLQRREFNEHLTASGRFLWSNKRQQKLLSRAQDALMSHAKQRHPRLHALNARQTELELENILEEHYGIWTYAMEREAPSTKPEFFEQIKAIQQLWKLL